MLYLLNQQDNKKFKKSRVLVVEKNPITKQGYAREFDTVTMYAIYIQSIQKVMELLKDSIDLTKRINDGGY